MHTNIEVIFLGYPQKLVPLWAQVDNEIKGSACWLVLSMDKQLSLIIVQVWASGNRDV